MTAAHNAASKALCARMDETAQGEKGHRALMLDYFIFFMTQSCTVCIVNANMHQF